MISSEWTFPIRFSEPARLSLAHLADSIELRRVISRLVAEVCPGGLE